MGPGEGVLLNGAFFAGIIIGIGYLLIFPFWMIYKLDRILTRLKKMQEDIDAQDDTLKMIELRLETLDADVETRRKEIVEAVNLFRGKREYPERPN